MIFIYCCLVINENDTMVVNIVFEGINLQKTNILWY